MLLTHAVGQVGGYDLMTALGHGDGDGLFRGLPDLPGGQVRHVNGQGSTALLR